MTVDCVIVKLPSELVLVKVETSVYVLVETGASELVLTGASELVLIEASELVLTRASELVLTGITVVASLTLAKLVESTDRNFTI